jgi:hypothetical protein
MIGLAETLDKPSYGISYRRKVLNAHNNSFLAY